MTSRKKYFFSIITLLTIAISTFAAGKPGMISGKVLSTDGEPIDFATVFLKGTSYTCSTDEKGLYHLSAPAGDYTIVYTSVGFDKKEFKVNLKAGERDKMVVKLKPSTNLGEVIVVGNQLSKVKNSAFNATAINTRELTNTTKTLSEALAKAPGMKIRESGGVGSDMAVTMDGFSGKHVKVFIDGVPQEGVGSSFGLNNIPVNFADRIEIYRGVVPVGFGADAIGGIINIVTPRRQRKWFMDASYSYGSFNTHKSYVNFGQTLRNGFKYEINAFQNYSDNNYKVDVPVEDFTTGSLDTKTLYRVNRFNDKYHNEAVMAKLGFVNKSWADRILMGINYSHMYQEVQTGVRQKIVFGQKHRHGNTLMGSLEYSKRNLLTQGIDVSFNANYNRNLNTNVDTAAVRYNWLGETIPISSPSEQSNQLSEACNNNWTATFTANYRLGRRHMFTLNNVFNTFNRSNRNLLTTPPSEDEFAKVTSKNIVGLSYRYTPVRQVSLSAFGKQYHQYVSGPVTTTSAQDEYTVASRTVDYLGYGVAGTWFMPLGFQLKASYEKAYRLPTIEEIFGDEDLEMGEMDIKPESSNNINLNLSYDATFGSHTVYVESGLIYRDTRDYIQRNIASLSGGKFAATYINYGKVKTTGVNVSARYSFSKWVSLGGNLTYMNVRDKCRTMPNTTAANLSYGQRMPNLPYFFADSDINFYWIGLGRKTNTLTVTYDNQYTRKFCYYSSIIGSNSDEYMIPDQFAHNLTFTYSIRSGRYNISLECRNFTDAKLYDNFSLQKAGRAFYGKFRIYFGN